MNNAKSTGTGSYIQLFLYRVPRQNHDAFLQTQNKLANIFKKHGIIGSEFFELSPSKPFGGFMSIAQTVSAGPEEEVWLELEHYRDAKNKDEAVASIGKDPSAGPLFGQVMGLAVQGALFLQGDFVRQADE